MDSMIIDLCICTADRDSYLAECLGAVAAMKREKIQDCEVRLVVVVNGADRSGLDDIRRIASATGLPATVIHEPVRGIPFARNRAVQTALAQDSEAVAFIDDDDLPDPGWLGDLVEVANRTGADLVLGCWRLPPDLALPPILKDVRFFKEPDPDATNRYGLPAWAGTYNMLIRTSLIERLADAEGHLFDPAYASTGGSDTDLFVRAARAGGIVRAAPRSTVVRRWEPHRISVGGVIRRAFRLGATQAMIDARYREKRLNRRRLRRRFGDVAIAIAALCTVRAKAALGIQLVRIAEISGEIYGRMGGKAQYYQVGPGSRTPINSK
jgi:glycosyltransferase involved in cell wall biosynthesis